MSLFTSESVSMGHPDKVSDQISDAILDAMLAVDPNSRVACETLVNTGLVVIAGEVTCDGYVDIAEIARNTIREIGYDDPKLGFDADSCAVMVTLDKQSPDIAQGVNKGEGLHEEQGAGDQGMMFGFACNETEELMPFAVYYSHRLVEKHAEVRKAGVLPYLRPDAKSQLTVEYDDDGKIIRVHTVVISTQHSDDVTLDEIKEGIIKEVINPIMPAELMDENTIIHVNPTGRFVIGGPKGDCGLTGRKIIVDTYGGMGRHGGGAFSGKDPSKVDRSAAYMARYIAKNIVGAGLADKCEVQLAYAIGVAEPVSVLVDTFQTGTVDEKKLSDVVQELFSLTPSGIVKSLDLLKPKYKITAAHGHFGRKEDSFTWEKLDKVEDLKSAFNK
ncbi:MAG: methionine adenosyltransferase [Planctomycetota bacterium]|nr:MAG: methionine adenosyltransferase [Planctomycetota bacterium]